MKCASGLQTPDRSILPSAVRGAGLAGPDARLAVAIASPWAAARTFVPIGNIAANAAIIASPSTCLRTRVLLGPLFCSPAARSATIDAEMYHAADRRLIGGPCCGPDRGQ